MTDLLVTYKTAFVCATLVVILAVVQSLVGAAFKFGPGKGVAGVPVGDSPGSLPFRLERSHLNTVENIGTFGLILILAILVGVPGSWVNGVALVFLVARGAHFLCYALGLAPVRTLCFAIGIFATLALAIKTLLVLL